MEKTSAVKKEKGEDETVEHLEWNKLREYSLRPGGFGEDRVRIWPLLLGADISGDGSDWNSLPPHQDERQIRLDTDRSFVLYPVNHKGEPEIDGRGELKDQLNDLIVSLFRRRPKLSYFQGFHDISTVFFLTLPPSTQYPCLENMSLQRLRDSMGNTLEPVLGLVRITRNLLRLADPGYAAVLEQTSPLPFYALSNLLTLLAHDMPTLLLIQHVFDYLLARPPIASVYLTTAILLARKAELEKLRQDDEDDDGDLGMVHSMLSTLLPIVDDDSETELAVKEEGNAEGAPGVKAEEEEEEEEATEQGKVTPNDIENEDDSTAVKLEADTESPEPPPFEASPSPSPSSPMSTPPSPPSPSTSPLPPLSRLTSFPLPKRSLPPRPLSLTTLLLKADELYMQYPPSHPGLEVGSIMGKKSVVFTWSEEFEKMHSKEEAEGIVGEPESVVFPFIEDDATIEEENEDELDLIVERKRGEKGRGMGRARNRLRRTRRGWYLSHRRQAIVTTSVLVLGVALAVYSGGQGREQGVRGWSKMVAWVAGVVVGLE